MNLTNLSQKCGVIPAVGLVISQSKLPTFVMVWHKICHTREISHVRF